jgi:hypothetical protein
VRAELKNKQNKIPMKKLEGRTTDVKLVTFVNDQKYVDIRNNDTL